MRQHALVVEQRPTVGEARVGDLIEFLVEAVRAGNIVGPYVDRVHIVGMLQCLFMKGIERGVVVLYELVLPADPLRLIPSHIIGLCRGDVTGHGLNGRGHYVPPILVVLEVPAIGSSCRPSGIL